MKRGVWVVVSVLLITVVSMLFVLATSWDVAPSTARAGDTVSVLVFNITSVTGISGHNLTTLTLLLTGNASIGNISSINVSDGTNDYSNGSITGTTVTIDVSNVNASALGSTNLTINATLDSSATYGVAFGINITSVGAQTNVTVNITTNSSQVFVTESTDPTVYAPVRTDRTSTTITTDFVDAKCSDSGSGIASCALSSSGGTVEGNKITGLTCGKSYTVTITATDNAGNTASASDSLSTTSCGTSGGVVPPKQPKSSYSFSKITPGVATIVKDFDSKIGVKEIQINVNNEAQNVKITVVKHDGKPAAVSVAKSGDVYQYIEIDAENLGDDFGRAKVQFRVEKSWVNSNLNGKEDVGVFRFNDNSNVWDELSTTFAGEDATHYYYDVELTGFSFFSVSEKTLISPDNDTGGADVLGNIEGGIPSWIWIIVAIVVIALLWVAVGGKKKRRH